MKKQIQNGNDFLVLKDCAFQQAYIHLIAVPTAGNVLDSKSINLQTFIITIEAQNEGIKKTVSFNGVGPAMKYTVDNPSVVAKADINWNDLQPTFKGISNYGIVDENSFMKLPLLENWILKGSDYVKISVQWNKSNVFQSMADPNLSQAYICTKEGNDITQIDMNLPDYIPINNTTQSPSFSWGSISRMYLLTSINSNPFNSINFNSEQVHLELDSDDLALMAYENNVRIIPSLSPPDVESFQSSMIKIIDVEPSAITKVNVNMSIDTASVTSNCSYVYIEEVITSKSITLKGLAHAKKVERRKLSFRGL